MDRRTNARSVWPVRLVMLGLLVTSSGCVNGVGWLPDSSGFVYCTCSRKLILYDVKKKSQKVLVADTKSNTYWPAVSPDGKRVAVAGLTFDGPKEGKLQVAVYDLEGRETHRSPFFPWGVPEKGEPDDTNTMTQLFWSPDGNKIIVYGSVHAAYGTSGLYDLTSKRMAQWARAVPSIYGTTPIRPDGKGFLLARLDKGGETLAGLAFVGWDGREKPIRLKFDPNRESPDAPPPGLLLAWPVLRWSWWEGDMAVVTSGTSRIRIDTAKEVGSLHTVEKAEVSVGDQFIWQRHTFPGEGTRLSILTPKKGKESYYEFQVEASDSKGEKRRTLVPKGSNRLLGLFPSPDGQHAVLRIWEGDRKGPDADLLFLVNRQGEVVTEIDLHDDPKEKPRRR